MIAIGGTTTLRKIHLDREILLGAPRRAANCGPTLEYGSEFGLTKSGSAGGACQQVDVRK